MIYKIVLPLIFVGSLLGRPINDAHELRVEASIIAGMDTIILDTSIPGGKAVKSVQRGSRTGLVYLTNLTDRTLRIPTRGFDLQRKQLDKHDQVTLIWSESSGDKRLVVVPASDLGVVEVGQNETARIYFDFAEDWPDDRPIRICFSVSDWAMKKYSLDFCGFEVALRR